MTRFSITVHPGKKTLPGSISLPPDKSISHRVAMLAAQSDGTCRIRNFSQAEDTASTLSAVKTCGISIHYENSDVIIQGKGLRGLQRSGASLDCGNSGTTARLMMGLLARSTGMFQLVGDDSLSRRPMEAVAEPLRAMGAVITTKNGCLPVRVTGRALQGIDYTIHSASAQTKSAILLAGLGATGITIVREPLPTRDHTERLLQYLGVPIEQNGNEIRIQPVESLSTFDVTVPGDPSAAAFPVAWAAMSGTEIQLCQICLNPGRDRFFHRLQSMGVTLAISDRQTAYEPVGNIVIKGGPLKPTVVHPNEVPGLIDELPILAVVAAKASGESRITGAANLRTKETDRITAIVNMLHALQIKAEELEDGFVIQGTGNIGGGTVDSGGDHRIAMAAAVAGLVAEDAVTILHPDCVNISWPGFWEAMGI